MSLLVHLGNELRLWAITSALELVTWLLRKDDAGARPLVNGIMGWCDEQECCTERVVT